MSIEVPVHEDLLAEVVQSKCQMYDHWIRREFTASLSSSCDIVWLLDGLQDEIRIQSNVMAALCLAFHGSQAESWSVGIEDILSLATGGQMAIEEPRIDAVGDHLNMLNDAFGTSTPDPDDEEALGILEAYVKFQLVSDIWHVYCRKLSEQDDDFAAPLFCASDGTKLRAHIESAADRQNDELMSAFG